MTLDLDPTFDRELHADAITWTLRTAPEATRDVPDLIVDTVIDAQAYRLVSQEAIHALHRVAVALDRLREQHQRLLDEHRALRRERAGEEISA